MKDVQDMTCVEHLAHLEAEQAAGRRPPNPTPRSFTGLNFTECEAMLSDRSLTSREFLLLRDRIHELS